jgi:hypothetical protein
MKRRINISVATKAALAAAKARGVRLGNPRLQPGTPETAAYACRAAVVAKREQSRARAADLAPVISAIRADGITSFGGIAAALADRGIPTPSGRGKWHPATVQRIVRRGA